MGILIAWASDHWFSLVQTLGIVGGFVIAARSLSIDTRTRAAEIHLAITEAHRDIWENLVSNANLAEVLDPTRNVHTSPVAPIEERFVLLVLTHTAAVHRAMSLSVFKSWEGLEADVREFFMLPVPSCVLKRYLPYQEKAFIAFMTSLTTSPPNAKA